MICASSYADTILYKSVANVIWLYYNRKCQTSDCYRFLLPFLTKRTFQKKIQNRNVGQQSGDCIFFFPFSHSNCHSLLAFRHSYEAWENFRAIPHMTFSFKRRSISKTFDTSDNISLAKIDHVFDSHESSLSRRSRN